MVGAPRYIVELRTMASMSLAYNAAAFGHNLRLITCIHTVRTANRAPSRCSYGCVGSLAPFNSGMLAVLNVELPTSGTNDTSLLSTR